MNTNELMEQERYHLQMAKVYQSHVGHHVQMARNFHDRRKKLKLAIDIEISKQKAADILQDLTKAT